MAHYFFADVMESIYILKARARSRADLETKRHQSRRQVILTPAHNCRPPSDGFTIRRILNPSPRDQRSE